LRWRVPIYRVSAHPRHDCGLSLDIHSKIGRASSAFLQSRRNSEYYRRSYGEDLVWHSTVCRGFGPSASPRQVRLDQSTTNQHWFRAQFRGAHAIRPTGDDFFPPEDRPELLMSQCDQFRRTRENSGFYRLFVDNHGERTPEPVAM